MPEGFYFAAQRELSRLGGTLAVMRTEHTLAINFAPINFAPINFAPIILRRLALRRLNLAPINSASIITRENNTQIVVLQHSGGVFLLLCIHKIIGSFELVCNVAETVGVSSRNSGPKPEEA